MRVLIVFGTRPEIIKLAPVIRALREQGSEALLCATAQHRDMLDQMLCAFDLHADFDLDVMRTNQSPSDVAGRMFSKLTSVVETTRPDWLVVQGDTTTTFVAAWVGFHCGVPVAHVEAGLRTEDKLRPFPEEMNRRLTSVLADLHFAPTRWAKENLLAEGVPRERIFVAGNPVVDAVCSILDKPVHWTNGFQAPEGRLFLLTAHRRENFGVPLEQICAAVIDLVRLHPDLTGVVPVHRNPAVRRVMSRMLSGVPRIVLTEPLSYPCFVHLMRRAELILSDSGGVQEEAPSVGTPVLVLRQVTERPEAILSGWAQLVGTSRLAIVEAANQWLQKEKKQRRSRSDNPFGDGHAGERIANLLAVHALRPRVLRENAPVPRPGLMAASRKFRPIAISK